jgi:hypothetical protein
MKSRFLTKSLFVRALDCPRKIFYAGKPEYADNSVGDEFLASLAEGGIQVGALARCYFPDGILVEGLDKTLALERTNELLKKDRVTLFEAAIQYGSCYFRADILVKNGNCFDLIEVKAKSYDQDTAEGFLKKRGEGINTEWQPYIYDVAFQKHVFQHAFPKAMVRAHLMLADTRAKASVEGLNQRFVLRETNGRMTVSLQGDCTPAGLGDRILVQVPVDDALNLVSEGEREETAGRAFADYVAWLAEHYQQDKKIDWPVGLQCKDCEFKPSPAQRQKGYRSGFCECWQEQWGLTEEDLQQPNVFDIWFFRKTKALLNERRFLLRDVTQADILGDKESKKAAKSGLSRAERQWLQVDKAQRGDRTAYFDRAGFLEESAAWRYPLHFIDFETSAVAIPFNRGHGPYEGLAFQFSHHIVHKDGRIAHAGQYLNAKPGVFPNFDFIRHLKRELENDDGTIFRYAAHENTFLNHILNQLQEEPADAVPDREALREWIKTITQSTKGPGEQWEGARNMVDMCELVKRYYYDPFTQGSNSIKWVLPAVLNSSAYLKKKYSQPIYGTKGGIPSLNYQDQNWLWIKPDGHGGVMDPYHLLPNVAPEISVEQLDYAEEHGGERLANGGAAMMAYARLQFTHIPDTERRELESALLRYCELDTMAMVFIWEHWINLVCRC